MQKKLKNKKGFTLAELLVVVAIIAVLVAIAIPVFGSALTKAKGSAALANVRAAYAETLVKAMTEKDYGQDTVTITIQMSDIKTASGVNDADVDVTYSTNQVTVTYNNEPVGSFPVDSDVTISGAWGGNTGP